ncbi:MAG: calcium-binding protein, partial [Shimia sp.]
IDAGGGADEVQGGSGFDLLRGGNGADLLLGNSGRDLLEGGRWHDVLDGGPGSDVLRGEEHDDLVFGADASDTISGDEGDDVLAGGTGKDAIFGGEGNDLLSGGGYPTPPSLDTLRELQNGADLDPAPLYDDDRQADTLDGGAGDDVLILGPRDLATGDEGEDTFIALAAIDDAPAAQIEDYETDEDTLSLSYVGETPPEVTVEDDGADAIVRADGIATILVRDGAGTVTPDDVTLVRIG